MTKEIDSIWAEPDDVLPNIGVYDSGLLGTKGKHQHHNTQQMIEFLEGEKVTPRSLEDAPCASIHNAAIDMMIEKLKK